MTDYIFDWSGVDSLFDNWNINFLTDEMNGDDNFQLVFCQVAPTNINDCLNNGVLDTSTVPTASSTSVDCGLIWDTNAKTIRLANKVTWNIGDNNYNLKAVFLRNKSNGYVLGYCININDFEVTNKVKFLKDTIFWSIE